MDLKMLVLSQIDGCVITSENGVKLYTPDGRGNYRALWTRDFYYMLENAAELIPLDDIRSCLEYIYSHAREADGWIPDRVDAHGVARYTAGNFDEVGIAQANLDNNAFAVLCASEYLKRINRDEAKAFLDRWQKCLMKALYAVPTGDNGLVYNDPSFPHSPYGFTDCICKTGYLAMESLLLWRAFCAAAEWGDTGCLAAARKIETGFEAAFFPDGDPLPVAATIDCRQRDIWAACYALYIGFPFSAARRKALRIALSEQYADFTQSGQIRHMPIGQYWDRLLVDVPRGEYQNGAYWATPVMWFTQAILPDDPSLAQHNLNEMLADFEKAGCCECINGAYRKLPDYVASAAAAYGAEKAIKAFSCRTFDRE